MLQSSHTEKDKEAALRKMAEAWNYLAAKILPTMRYADIEFDYGVDEVVTRTTLVSQPKPETPPTSQPASQPSSQPAQTTQPQQEWVVVDEEMGIIVATPKSDAEQRKECRKEMREEKKSKK